MDPALRNYQLSNYLPAGKPFNTEDITFARISTDAQNCQPGDLFIAIVSAAGDGHDQIDVAFENGAVGILAERLLPTNIPMVLVQDTRTAYSRLNQALHGNPTSNVRTIAVTGTPATRSFTHLLSHAYNHCGIQTGVIAPTTQHPDGPLTDHYTAAIQTLQEAGADTVILELTPEELSSRIYDGLEFDRLVLTGVDTIAEEFDGSTTAYENSIGRAYSLLKPNGVAIINLADPITRFEFLPTQHPFLSVGNNDEADVSAQLVEQGRSGQRFRIFAGESSAELFTPILGPQHIYNCLQAIATGLLDNLDFPKLCEALQSYDHSPGQLMPISHGQPFDVFLDRADTAKQLSRAIRALRQVTNGKLIVVYGPSAAQPKPVRVAMGQVAEKFADVSIITENNPEYENPLEIAHDVLDGYTRSADAYVIPGRERAIVWALTQAEPEDTVLICGKGDDTSHVMGSEVFYFDDAEIVKICLEEIQHPVAKYGRDVFRIDDYRES